MEKIIKINDTEFTFRPIKLRPAEFFGLGWASSNVNISSGVEIGDFALEHLEVKINDNWIKVKQKDKEVYMPIVLNNDIKAICELIEFFLNEVLTKAF